MKDDFLRGLGVESSGVNHDGSSNNVIREHTEMIQTVIRELRGHSVASLGEVPLQLRVLKPVSSETNTEAVKTLGDFLSSNLSVLGALVGDGAHLRFQRLNSSLEPHDHSGAVVVKLLGLVKQDSHVADSGLGVENGQGASGSSGGGEKELRVADLSAEVPSELEVFAFFGDDDKGFSESNLVVNLASEGGRAQHLFGHVHAFYELLVTVTPLVGGNKKERKVLKLNRLKSKKKEREREGIKNHLGNGGSWFDLSSFGENEDEEGDYNRREDPPHDVRDLPPPSRPPEIQPSPPVHSEKRARVIQTLKPRSDSLIDCLVASVVGSDLGPERPAFLSLSSLLRWRKLIIF